MTLTPLRLSVPASDGLLLKGTLTSPPGATGRSYRLAVLAHEYSSTRDSLSPLLADVLADLLTAGGATLASCQQDEAVGILPRGLGA